MRILELRTGRDLTKSGQGLKLGDVAITRDGTLKTSRGHSEDTTRTQRGHKDETRGGDTRLDIGTLVTLQREIDEEPVIRGEVHDNQRELLGRQ